MMRSGQRFPTVLSALRHGFDLTGRPVPEVVVLWLCSERPDGALSLSGLR